MMYVQVCKATRLEILHNAEAEASPKRLQKSLDLHNLDQKVLTISTISILTINLDLDNLILISKSLDLQNLDNVSGLDLIHAHP